MVEHKYVQVEQNQPYCDNEDLGYTWYERTNQQQWFDKEEVPEKIWLSRNVMIEQNNVGRKIGYCWFRFCNDQHMFDYELTQKPKIMSIF